MRSRPAVRRLCSVLTAACAAATVLSGAVPPPAVAAVRPAAAGPVRVNGVLLTAFEAGLLGRVNAARRAHRLRPLAVAPCAEDFARGWARQQASAMALRHNPHLTDLWGSRRCDLASMIDENVGMSPNDPAVVFAAYRRSPRHWANILDRDMRYVGVAAWQRNGVVFDVLDFTDAAATRYGPPRSRGQGLSRG